MVLGAAVLLIMPLAWGLREPGFAGGTVPKREQTIVQALREAFRYRSFQLLMAGYFVCGFQVVFIGVHMPSYLKDNGLSPQVASYALALIGLFNVIGTYAAGALGQRMPKRYILAFIYFARGGHQHLPDRAAVAHASVYVFSAVMGLLWLSTVPPTNAVVAQIFGVAHLSMLGGFVFFSHQIGSFMGVWLGGVLYDRTGSYDIVWYISIALGVFAALINLPVRESPIVRGPTAHGSAAHEQPHALPSGGHGAGPAGHAHALQPARLPGEPGRPALELLLMHRPPTGSPGAARPRPGCSRWTHLIPAGGAVLDVACGHGRHLRWLAERGHRVTGVDRSPEAIAAVAPLGRAVLADIENGPWPLEGETFDAVVVTNYLWRPCCRHRGDSVAPGGVLLYETFASGNETVGRPARPDFLLQAGELLQACAGLRVVAFEDGFCSAPERFVQRIAAVRETGPIPPRRCAICSTPLGRMQDYLPMARAGPS
jgi:SAM-dependent methyltransferase